MKRRCELSGAHSISVILVTPGMGIVVTANPAGTAAEWSLKAIPSTPRRLSILPGIIILTIFTQNLQTGATSLGLTAANRDKPVSSVRISRPTDRQLHSTHDVDSVDCERRFIRADGSFSFINTNAPPGTAYYRLVQH